MLNLLVYYKVHEKAAISVGFMKEVIFYIIWNSNRLIETKKYNARILALSKILHTFSRLLLFVIFSGEIITT